MAWRLTVIMWNDDATNDDIADLAGLAITVMTDSLPGTYAEVDELERMEDE